MGLKHDNLIQLKQRGLNTFEFELISNNLYEDIRDYIYKNPNGCTFRADSKQQIKQLPFFEFNGNINKPGLDEFVGECEIKGYTVVASNGKKYDNIQKANIVVHILKNGEVFIEVSERKVPLRKMYNYPSELCTYKGELGVAITKYKPYGKLPEGVTRTDLSMAIDKVFKIMQPNERDFEMILYPREVGLLNENLIFWQISK